MSSFIEFVLPDITRVEGLAELVASWATESFPHDPPRYIYEGLAFTLVPVAKHVHSALPFSLRSVEHCLELDEALVLAWEGGRLPLESEHALRTFVLAVSKAADQWAAVYDPSGGALSSSHVGSNDAYERLASVVKPARPERGMAVLVVNR